MSLSEFKELAIKANFTKVYNTKNDRTPTETEMAYINNYKQINYRELINGRQSRQSINLQEELDHFENSESQFVDDIYDDEEMERVTKSMEKRINKDEGSDYDESP